MKYKIRCWYWRYMLEDLLWISGHWLKVLSEKVRK
jgi:hypothetical protein